MIGKSCRTVISGGNLLTKGIRRKVEETMVESGKCLFNTTLSLEKNKKYRKQQLVKQLAGNRLLID